MNMYMSGSRTLVP